MDPSKSWGITAFHSRRRESFSMANQRIDRSPAGFRARHGMTKYTYNKLRNLGLGPKESWAGTFCFIAEKDEARFDQQARNPPPARQRVLEREAQFRHARAKAAGLASAAARRQKGQKVKNGERHAT